MTNNFPSMRILCYTELNKIRHAMLISRIGIQSEKNIRLAGRWARFAAITDPRFPDYIPQRMTGMAVNSGPHKRLT